MRVFLFPEVFSVTVTLSVTPCWLWVHRALHTVSRPQRHRPAAARGPCPAAAGDGEGGVMASCPPACRAVSEGAAPFGLTCGSARGWEVCGFCRQRCRPFLGRCVPSVGGWPGTSPRPPTDACLVYFRRLLRAAHSEHPELRSLGAHVANAVCPGPGCPSENRWVCLMAVGREALDPIPEWNCPCGLCMRLGPRVAREP